MFKILIVILAVMLMVGCGVSQEVKDNTHAQRIAVGAYVDNFMDKGTTTKEQDQKVIRQCYRTLLLLDWGVNDNEEAKALYTKLDEQSK